MASQSITKSGLVTNKLRQRRRMSHQLELLNVTKWDKLFWKHWILDLSRQRTWQCSSKILLFVLPNTQKEYSGGNLLDILGWIEQSRKRFANIHSDRSEVFWHLQFHLTSPSSASALAGVTGVSVSVAICMGVAPGADVAVGLKLTQRDRRSLARSPVLASCTACSRWKF